MVRRITSLGGVFLRVLLYLPLAILSRLLALVRAERSALRLGARVQRAWARGVLKAMGVALELDGRIPPGPCLVVANHVSYLDIPVLSALFPGRFVAKSEIAGWPVLGPLAATVGTIFTAQKRGRDVLRVEREMARTLAAGVPVVLFPEGHSTRGASVDRFHSSLLECAARGAIPCLAVAIAYETPRDPWAPASTVCWWGGMRFWRHVWDLAGLHGIRARVRVAEKPLVVGDRKRLAEALHALLVARFQPTRQTPIAPDGPWAELFLGVPSRADGASEASGDTMTSSPLPEET